jgi:hypothetical protein
MRISIQAFLKKKKQSPTEMAAQRALKKKTCRETEVSQAAAELASTYVIAGVEDSMVEDDMIQESNAACPIPVMTTRVHRPIHRSHQQILCLPGFVEEVQVGIGESSHQ